MEIIFHSQDKKYIYYIVSSDNDFNDNEINHMRQLACMDHVISSYREIVDSDNIDQIKENLRSDISNIDDYKVEVLDVLMSNKDYSKNKEVRIYRFR